jgi:hypothetical protein
MTTLITKTKTALSNAVLFATAIFIVGLGFAFVGTIALFGLIAVGAAMIASLFITPAMDAATSAETVA